MPTVSSFTNVYDDDARARAYAELAFPGTYYLAYRDLPEIIRAHVRGTRALDFGCGAGRSTRFLRDLGFQVIGVDIAPPMLARARELDPAGDYRLVSEHDLVTQPEGFDLILSAFTFDNVPTGAQKAALLRALGTRLADSGRIVNLVSSPEIYKHEWASFTTRDFPGNAEARSGDRVRIVMLDVPDARPVEDVLWSPEAYAVTYAEAGLTPIATHRPLGKPSDPIPWASETSVAPWIIDVLRRS
jgi:SAM-dependent methyltransferase